MTVHDELLAMGYGHRKYGEHASKHEIYVIATGEIIGRFHAADAVDAALRHQCSKAAHERVDRLVEILDNLAYALLINADTLDISAGTLQDIRNDLDKLKR